MAHALALTSYVALLLTLCIWYFVIAPPQYAFSTVLRILFIAILLLPMKGLLGRNPRVYLWSSYLILLYFMHGTVEAWANDEQRVFALLEILFSVIYFVSATLCVRQTRKSLH